MFKSVLVLVYNRESKNTKGSEEGQGSSHEDEWQEEGEGQEGRPGFLRHSWLRLWELNHLLVHFPDI